MSSSVKRNAYGEPEISIKHILEARQRIAGYVRKTPLVRADHLSDLSGSEVYLKLENLQKLNAFKIRGMVNRVLCMSPEEKRKGILVVSSGNHGIAAGYCGQLWGIPVEVYVSKMTPASKIEGIKRFGARLRVVGDNYDEAMRALRADMNAGAVEGTYVDSSDDPMVVAGYGTIGLEIADELQDLDRIIVPVGGGGLVTGVGLAVKAVKPAIKVVGVQTAACPAMISSLSEGKIHDEYPSLPSICEALIGGIGRLPYEYASRCIDSVVEASEDAIRYAVRVLWQREKVVSEPSGSVGVAYILEHLKEFHGTKVAVVVSGGNIGLDILAASVSQACLDPEKRG